MKLYLESGQDITSFEAASANKANPSSGHSDFDLCP